MKKNINIVYICIILIILLFPAITLNTKGNQVSAIDNKILMEWDEVKKSSDKTNAFEQYIQDRIGFRETALYSYISINQQLFHYLSDPRRMYGKDGHIFFADENYISDYQHTNMPQDKTLCESMVNFLCRAQDYCDSQGIPFIYCLIPDKKTIYSEYFPDYYHILPNLSRTEYLLDLLNKTDLDYVYPKAELLSGKTTEPVYFKEYDPTHWNANGAFIGQKAIFEHIQKYLTNINIPDKRDFTISHNLVTTIANIQINESLPVYTLNNSINIIDESSLNPLNADARYFTHYKNPDNPDAPKILVLCDSYFYDLEMYYYPQFSEVTFLHNRRNITRIQEFIDYYNPDIVIFENVERVLSVDYSTELLDSITYYFY